MARGVWKKSMSHAAAYSLLALILVVFLAVVTAKTGREKGGDPLIWFVVGMLLPGITLIVALFLDETAVKECPSCTQRIKRDARICGYCRYQFTVRDNLRGW